MHNATKTIIRGVEYPSLTAAAKALGVTVCAVWYALENDRLETVGLRQHGQKRACYINGARWPSRTAAARALGVTRAAISKAITEGRGTVRVGGRGGFA